MACHKLRTSTMGVVSCITPRQIARAFGPKHTGARELPSGVSLDLRPIGCGTRACVYETDDPTRVVKLTSDETDAAALLQARGLRHVARLDRVGVIHGAGRHGHNLYALTVERLQRVPRYMEDWIDDVHGAYANRLCNGDQAQAREGLQELRRMSAGNPERRRFYAEAIRTWHQLQRRGVTYCDLSPDNVGVDANGTWKILDLGYTDPPRSALRHEAQAFDGAQRARRVRPSRRAVKRRR